MLQTHTSTVTNDRDGGGETAWVIPVLHGPLQAVFGFTDLPVPDGGRR